MKCIKYDPDTGKIIYSLDAPFEIIGIQEGSFIFSDPLDPRQWYVKDKIATPRPDNQITVSKTTINADGIDAAIISGVPAGAIVRIQTDRETRVISDGTDIHLTSAKPMKILVHIEAFPLKEKEVTIYAN
jgi:hypothetical protein